jgi:hypothetical protein
MARKLTTRQQTFCQEYVNGGLLSAISAASVAGYRVKTKGDKVNACKLLTNTTCKNEIQRLVSTRKATVEVTKEWVVRQHLDAIERCKLKGDESNAVTNLVAIGKTMGIYSDNLNFTDIVKRAEFEADVVREYKRIACIVSSSKSLPAQELVDVQRQDEAEGSSEGGEVAVFGKK